jgi:hypothetical protein
MARNLLLFDSYDLVFVGRPLWREDGSVFCICCWSSPANYFSGPSPLGLVTISYCLRFETSPFVASYESQGNGGDIRLLFHTVISLWVCESYITTDGQSASLSWYIAPTWGLQSDFYYSQTVAVFFLFGALSLTRGRVCRSELLLVLANAVILGSKSLGIHYDILLSSSYSLSLDPRKYRFHRYGPKVLRLLFPYSLPRKRAYLAVAYQWTSVDSSNP